MLSALYKAIILKNQGPWGSGPRNPGNGGGNGPQNPWGNRGGNQGGGNGGGGRGPDPDDLDAMLRNAQDRFKNVFGQGGGHRGGNRGGSPGFEQGKGLGILALVIVLLWLASGFYRVEPQEDAVILTFGKWTDTRDEAGLGYAFPWPIQEVQKVDVAFDRRVEIGFRDRASARDAGGDVAGESMMLTGDENIIDIDFVVLWRISDAGKFLFQIRDPETTVKKVAESAMREIIARTPIQKALTEARGEVETDTKALMQKMLDEYNSGVVVNSVQLLKVDPPAQVVDAFDDVQRARADRERMRNEAETYRNDIVPRARGEAQKLLQDAEAYRLAVTSKAQGEAERFLSVYNAYSQAQDVTQRRMYLETMQEILKGTKKVIVGDKGAPILPYLPLDQLKAPATRAPAQAAPARP